VSLKICMFVYNNFKHDSRVLKEARTLTKAGYDVRVIAVLDKNTMPYEQLHGFRVIRVLKDPLHYKIIRAMKGTSRRSHWVLRLQCHFLASLKHRLNSSRSALYMHRPMN